MKNTKGTPEAGSHYYHMFQGRQKKHEKKFVGCGTCTCAEAEKERQR